MKFFNELRDAPQMRHSVRLMAQARGSPTLLSESELCKPATARCEMLRCPQLLASETLAGVRLLAHHQTFKPAGSGTGTGAA